MRIRNNGFTLIEILAVITILGIIMAITVPSVQKAIDASKDKSYAITVAQITKAAKDYILENPDFMVDLNETGTGSITLKVLTDGGYLEKDIKNPKTGVAFGESSIINITVSINGTYQFEFTSN